MNCARRADSKKRVRRACSSANRLSIPQRPLHLLDAGLGQRDRSRFQLGAEIAPLLQQRHNAGEGAVGLRRLFRLAADDQGRARFVDEDVVDLIHDGVDQAALHLLAPVGHHVFAQVVKAEFVVGTVGEVGGVRLRAGAGAQPPEVPQRGAAGALLLTDLVLRLALGGVVGRVVEVGRIVLQDAHAQAQAVIEGAHPAGVAPGQVVIDGYQMAAIALQGVEVQRQGGHQRLAFAGAHLRHLALVQDNPAQDLDVEVAHLQPAPARLPHHGERFRQQIIQRGALFQAPAEFRRLRPERLVGERPVFLLPGVHRLHALLETLDLPRVRIADDLAEDSHAGSACLRRQPASA